MAEKNRKSKKREAYDDAFKVKVIREYLDTCLLYTSDAADDSTEV